MSQSMSGCEKKLNYFCYVCGKFVIMPSRRKITNEMAEIYQMYFHIPVIQNADYVPTISCTSCSSGLRDWMNGKRESMPFGIPMIWTDPRPHAADNCYVCANLEIGINRQKSKKPYKEVKSAQLPIPHSENVPIPKRPSPTEQPPNVTPPCHHIEVSQQRMNIMSRQLKLSQARQNLLAQHLKAINILAPDVNVYGARGRQLRFGQFFTKTDDNTFAYCNDIRSLMSAMNYSYKSEEWRLFIDSSKQSLKAVLLFMNNTKSSVPVALSSNTKKTFDSMKKILDAIKYNEHGWKICADLKVIALLRGIEIGYTKNMCFLCVWDSRYSYNQYQKRDWPLRQTHVIRHHNVINVPLVPKEKVLLSPLYIKLGLVKNFIKALVNRENKTAFKRLQDIFPQLSEQKIKEGALNGPDICLLMQNIEFDMSLSDAEMIAWDCLKMVVTNVLGVHRSPDWRVHVNNMLQSFETISLNMSLKVHFLHYHQDQLENQLSSESDEHAERFHQVSAQLEYWYSGKRLDSLLADLCWNLQMELSDDEE